MHLMTWILSEQTGRSALLAPPLYLRVRTPHAVAHHCRGNRFAATYISRMTLLVVFGYPIQPHAFLSSCTWETQVILLYLCGVHRTGNDDGRRVCGSGFVIIRIFDAFPIHASLWLPAAVHHLEKRVTRAVYNTTAVGVPSRRLYASDRRMSLPLLCT